MLIPSVLECGSDCRQRLATLFHSARRVGACAISVAILASATEAQILRVVTYNIDQDTGSSGTPGSDLTTVLQGIGNAHLAGHAQPVDVLALQELYGDPSVTLSAIVSQLNATYPTANFDYDRAADPTTGNFLTGNGPSGLIYNKNTVQVLGTAGCGNSCGVAVGSASGSGAPRAPMRYTLAPKGYNDHSADFTIYVSHMKSGGVDSGGPPTNGERRNTEAVTIRNDAYTLNDSLNGTTSIEVAHVIYAGDYNWDGATEDAYQTMISTSIHSGIMKANDTLNPANNWDTTSTYKALLTESATNVQYRDDVQLVSTPMLNQSGMQLVPNTLTAFGNGGGIYHQSVTNSANSAALTDLTPASYRTSVLNALTTATDHLPVVADYSFATAVGAPGDFNHSGVVDAADNTLWRSTFGTTGGNLLADGNHNNVVDAADYLIWRRYRASGSGAESLTLGAEVPEPASWLLMLSGCLAYLRGSRLRG